MLNITKDNKQVIIPTFAKITGITKVVDPIIVLVVERIVLKELLHPINFDLLNLDILSNLTSGLSSDLLR